jgi:uncharacterized delta-60 repeat protein
LFVERLEDRTVLSAGDLDLTFGTGGTVSTDLLVSQADSANQLVVVQADGKAVAVGDSGRDFALARYNPDGSLDTSFGSSGQVTTDFGTTDLASGVALQADGKIVVAGSSGGNFALARYHADGSLDSSFGSGGKVTTSSGSAAVVALQTDGKILVAGRSVGAGDDFALLRYNADGSLDSSFGSGGKVATDFGSGESASGLALQADGRIVVVGSRSANPFIPALVPSFALARYNVDGSLDNSFGTGGKVLTDFGSASSAGDVALQADGRIVAAGGSAGNFALARYNPNGTLDSSFGTGGKVLTNFGAPLESAFGVAVQADGRIVAAGSSAGNFALARYNADGSLDNTLGGSGQLTTDFGSGDSARDVALQADGRIVLAGTSGASGAGGLRVFDFALARYHADGSLDSGFGSGGKVLTNFSRPGGADVGGGLVIQTDGRIVVAGSADTDFGLARYHADGSLDSSFGTGGKVTTDFNVTPDAALAVALQADGKIVAAGRRTVTGENDFALARYNADGSLDSSFGSGGKVTANADTSQSGAFGVAVQPDGKIVVAGRFRPQVILLLRYNTDGSLDSSFSSDGQAVITNTSFSSLSAFGVAVQADGKLVVAGGSGVDFFLARVHANGSPDSSFGTNGQVLTDFGTSADQARGLVLQADGRILVAGRTASDFALARYHPDGTLDGTFGTAGKVTTDFGTSSDFAFGLALRADGKIVLAGSSGGNFALARYNADGSLDGGFGSGGQVTTDFGSASDSASGVALQADGRIVLAGTTLSSSTGSDFALVRYRSELVVVGTPGNDTIDIAPGTQTGTVKVTLNGLTRDNVTVLEQVLVFGGDGNDTITVRATGPVALTVDGQGGADAYTVHLGSLAGPVTVSDGGATATDSLTVHGTPGADAITITDTQVTRGSPVAETVNYAGVEGLTVNGAGGNDVLDDLRSNTTLLGGAGDDTVIVRATLAGTLLVDGQDGSDNFLIHLGSLLGAVSLTDSGTTGTDRVTIQATAGNDVLLATATQVTRGAETITYGATLENLTLRAGAGTDTLTVNSTGPSGLTVDGQDGSDSVTVHLGSLAGPVTLADSGTGDTDAVTIQGTPGDEVLTLTAAQLTGGGETIHFGQPVAQLTVDGGGGNTQVTVVSSPAPQLTLHRVAPTVGAIAAPLDPVRVNTAISTSATFTDPDVSDTHTAVWSWGDGTTSAGTVTQSNGSGTVTGSHTYTAAGVYTVTLTVTDSGGGSSRSVFQFVVIFDPSAGFVTGGGWIDSPAGAYPANPALTGKANFGFNAKYHAGTTVPKGNLEFQLKGANLKFHSTRYDWLVLAGARAQVKGTGTINGAGSYQFLLTVIDGRASGGGGQDKFRLKITGPGGVVYDNQPGAPDTADPSTVPGGGNIVIHTQGGGGAQGPTPAEAGEKEPTPLPSGLLGALLVEARGSELAADFAREGLSLPTRSSSARPTSATPWMPAQAAVVQTGGGIPDPTPVPAAMGQAAVSTPVLDNVFADRGTGRFDDGFADALAQL